MTSASGLSPTSSSPPNPSDTHLHPLDPLAPPFLPTNPVHQTFNTASETRRPHAQQSLSVSQLNCRSIRKNFSMVEHLLLTEWKSDVLCLSETWLQPHSLPDSALTIPGFIMHRRDRPSASHGGGLLVYLNSALRTQRRPDLEHRSIECIALEMTITRQNGARYLGRAPACKVAYGVTTDKLHPGRQASF